MIQIFLCCLAAMIVFHLLLTLQNKIMINRLIKNSSFANSEGVYKNIEPIFDTDLSNHTLPFKWEYTSISVIGQPEKKFSNLKYLGYYYKGNTMIIKILTQFSEMYFYYFDDLDFFDADGNLIADMRNIINNDTSVK